MNSHANISQPFIQPSHPAPCKQFNGWKALLSCHQGKLGELAGYLRAVKNASLNRFAVDTLNVQSADQVLEIGVGQGRVIQMIAERATTGLAAGIDVSEVLLQQATKHNNHLVKSGRVELSLASVASIPYEYGRFDKVLAVNNYQFWPNAEHNLTEIQRVLNKNGLLVLCLTEKSANSMFELASGYDEQEVGEIVGLLRWVGFRNVQLIRRSVGRCAAICVMAKR